MEKLKVFYEKIDSKIPVLLILTVIFFGVDIWYGMQTYDIFQKIGVYTATGEFKRIMPAPKPIIYKKKKVKPKPLFDIEKNTKEIPEKYKIILSSNIYVNPDLIATKTVGIDPGNSLSKKITAIVKPGETIDFSTLKKNENLPYIRNYSVSGIVSNNVGKVGSVFLVNKTGEKYYGRQGEKIRGTSITVKKIFDDHLILSSPGKKDTIIPFENERLLMRWKNNGYKPLEGEDE